MRFPEDTWEIASEAVTYRGVDPPGFTIDFTLYGKCEHRKPRERRTSFAAFRNTAEWVLTSARLANPTLRRSARMLRVSTFMAERNVRESDRTQRSTPDVRIFGIHPGWLTAMFALLLTALTVDALLRPRGTFDYELLRSLRRIDFPGAETIMEGASLLTGSEFAIGLWALMLVGFIATHRWLMAAALVAFPILGAVNTALRLFVGRTRPNPGEINSSEPIESVLAALARNDFESFPSGHVAGGILLWGFIFLLAGGIRHPLPRLGLQVLAVGIIATTGISRAWLGDHWVGDVLAGYAIGAIALIGVVVAYRSMQPTMTGIPLVKAAPVPHPEGTAHAHALTSTLLFRDGTVYKIYNPGFVPRLAYWLAFQAPFGYAHNRLSLEAAVLRRNLAGKLTEYWFGHNAVSPAYGIGEVEGRMALMGHFTEGQEPTDHAHAKAFLFDLADRFDEAGLPTWQIDPRQPRSLGNVLETPTGEYVIIDLESGLVSPVASPRAWARAIKRGLIPMYDDVFFDITRKYAEREAPAIREALGDAWLADLNAQISEAEAAADAWHRSEPRIWSRFARWVGSGFGIPALPHRLREKSRGGFEKADAWMNAAVGQWESEGRLTSEEAQRLHDEIEAPEFQSVLPHFGVHLAIGIALRFPFGAIARVSYTAANLLLAMVRLALRKIDRKQWRQDVSIHSPIVVALAALPGFGTFSYLASAPVRKNHLLARVILDAVGEKLPFHVYRKFGFKRLIARRPNGTSASGRAQVSDD